MNMFLTNVAMMLAQYNSYGNRIPGWLEALLTTVQNVINPILVVVATAGILYAIVVGVKFVKADSKEEREEAKQKLITVIIGVVVTLVLIAVFYWLAWAFKSGVFKINESWFGTGKNAQ